jgi:NAD(P)-dependent dehydrogenase (short-subunit alcohol dehydrogenase family)
MIDRHWGRIVNVASLAGLLPGVAGHTLYAASKSFVISFAESLALETASSGVHVTSHAAASRDGADDQELEQIPPRIARCQVSGFRYQGFRRI